MCLYPILVSMACLVTSCNALIMQNTPFNGAGRRPAPHPLLATFPSPKAIYLYTCFIRSVWNAYMLCSVRICKHSRESKSTCSRCTGGPGRLPAPSPYSVGGAVGGRGGEEAGKSCPAWGILSGEGGDLWQVNLAGYVRGWIWRVSMARHFGGSAWRVCLAGQFGSFIWRVFKAMLLSKKRNRKVRKCIW
jgi:hypothetical protein